MEPPGEREVHPAGGHITTREIRDAIITVDDGTSGGISAYVFDRFHQADRSTTRKFGGPGLGLAIVKHLVELHGGTVHAASEGLATGAFTVAIPRSCRTPDGLGEVPPPRRDAWKRCHSTACASWSSKTSRRVTEASAQERGAAVLAASSVEQALHLFRAGRRTC
jgi:hypothetical protein